MGVSQPAGSHVAETVLDFGLDRMLGVAVGRLESMRNLVVVVTKFELGSLRKVVIDIRIQHLLGLAERRVGSRVARTNTTRIPVGSNVGIGIDRRLVVTVVILVAGGKMQVVRQLGVQLDVRMRGFDLAVERKRRGHGATGRIRQERLVLRHTAKTQVAAQARLLAQGVAARGTELMELIVRHLPVTGSGVARSGKQVIPGQRPVVVAEQRGVITDLRLQFFVGITRDGIKQIGAVIDRFGRERRAAAAAGANLDWYPGELGAVFFLALVVHRNIPAGCQLFGQAETRCLASGLDVEALHTGCEPGYRGSSGPVRHAGRLGQHRRTQPVVRRLVTIAVQLVQLVVFEAQSIVALLAALDTDAPGIQPQIARDEIQIAGIVVATHTRPRVADQEGTRPLHPPAVIAKFVAAVIHMTDANLNLAVRSDQAAQVVIFRLCGQRGRKPDGRDGCRQDGAAEALFNCMFHYMFSLILLIEQNVRRTGDCSRGSAYGSSDRPYRPFAVRSLCRRRQHPGRCRYGYP